MDYISKEEDKCSCVGIYCVKSIENIVYPYWMGYKFDSDYYSIEKQFSMLYGLCHERKLKKNIFFTKFQNDLTSKSKNMPLDGKHTLHHLDRKM